MLDTPEKNASSFQMGFEFWRLNCFNCMREMTNSLSKRNGFKAISSHFSIALSLFVHEETQVLHALHFLEFHELCPSSD